jgi:hypothetical protein
MEKIKKWLPFSDTEIGGFQIYVASYFHKNKEKLSKDECFLLASLASEIQYQMRILKGRIVGEQNINIVHNNKFINELEKFDGLIEFVINEFKKDFNNLSLKKQYEYLSHSKNSYFNKDEELITELENDINKL